MNLQLFGGRGASGGSVKNVGFEEIINSSKNSLHFDRNITILPDNYIPESGRKKDLGKLIEKYNINDVVVKSYRDRTQQKDLQRMKDLGFRIVKQYRGEQRAGSSIPPEDRFLMKRKGK